MEAHKNRFIEDWSTARENLEYNFRWTRRNLALVGIFGVAIPILIYKGIVREFVRSLPSLYFSLSNSFPVASSFNLCPCIPGLGGLRSVFMSMCISNGACSLIILLARSASLARI